MASLFSDLSHETVTSVMPTLLASMGVAAGAMHDEVLAAVRECVTHDFKIAQATVQVESKGCAENETHL